MATVTSMLTAEQIGEYLRAALASDVLEVAVSYATARVTVEPEALPRAARLCKSDPRLACEFFDWMSAVDLGEQGFAVVTSLYSVRHRHRVHLRAIAPGGRDNPHLPSISGIYRGANWHERETYDMFGVTFDGHPGLLPRILTVENFEGWPLRKDFLLATREAKPWPGAKEPEERHTEEGPGQSQAVIANAEPLSAEQTDTAAAEAAAAPAERGEGAAPAGREEVEYDQAVFDQLVAEGKSERVARARAKAAAMRQRRAGPEQADASTAASASSGESEGAAAAQERSAAGDPAPSSPEGAAAIAEQDMADPSIAKDAAAGAVGGDVAAGAPGDEPDSDQPVSDLEQEARVGTGAPPVAGGTPGIESEGRHTGAREQSGAKPPEQTPGMTSAPPGGGDRVNTPAPGPESDVAPADAAPGVVGDEQDVPVRPAPGAETAPLASDEVADDPGVSETPVVHEDGAEPPQSSGTDAADRQPGGTP